MFSIYQFSNNYNRLLKKWLEKHPWVNVEDGVYLPLQSKVLKTPTEIRKKTNINGLLTIKGSRFVTIGKYCDIAENLFIISSNHEVNKLNLQARLQEIVNEQLDVSKGPVYIGNNVWIGDNVTILTGVAIGDGAVIGAGSIVTKDIPSYAITVGNPAKVINYRFSKKVIDKLLQLAWWHWDDLTILKNKDLFSQNITDKNIDEIIKKVDYSKEKEMTIVEMSDRNKNHYLLDGWGPREGDSRWVERKEAGTVLKLTNPDTYNNLSFYAYSYYKPQKININVNGHKYKGINLLNNWQEYHIPLRKLRVGVNVIRLSFSSGFSPIMTGDSLVDKRILYGRFTKFSLT